MKSLTFPKSPGTLLIGSIIAGSVLGIGLVQLIMALQVPKEITHREVKTMEVTGVNLRSKSKSTVDLKVVGGNTVYSQQRVYCRRYEAENIRVGSRWDVVIQDYKRGDRHGTELVGLEPICTLSQR